MITLRKIDNSKFEYIEKIAKLHKKAFPDFFLTKLGLPFLRTLYKGYLEDDKSGIIIAENKGRLVGFVAYSYDYPLFYKKLLKNHLFKFAICSFVAAVKHPSFIKRLLGAFNKSESVIKKERYVELSSICVNPVINNKGIGTKLINYLKGLVDFKEYSYINLETDASNNEKANKFYIKNGFVLARTYVTSEGRKMNEYRYTPVSNNE